MNSREIFYQHLAQTSPYPMLGNPLHIVKAKGSILWDRDGKEYIDLISGIAVSSVGHCHPHVVKAVQQQSEKFMHLMVYGEFIQEPQTAYSVALFRHLPSPLNNIYYTTGGSEAIEMAIKLSRKYTQRYKILCFRNSYHGSTLGAMSLMSAKEYRMAFSPLIPGIIHCSYDDAAELELAEWGELAAVIMEPIQAESGIRIPSDAFVRKIQEMCRKEGCLLVMDEIQTGFGRTGKWFAFEHLGVQPDILCIGKAMAGGVPMGACVARREIMQVLMKNPALGHMNTFGGNALSCEAARATLEIMERENLTERALEIEKFTVEYLKKNLSGTAIVFRMLGAAGAIEFPDEELAMEVCRSALCDGLLTDWFLFCPKALRIAPPLNIEWSVLEKALHILCRTIKNVVQK